jgi:outer membrane receptor protein involved in Fe transport
VGAFADGTQVSENAFDQRVRLDGRIHNASLFATHTYSLRDQWHTTLSARYNQTQLHNTDTVYPYNNATTLGDQRGSLDGNHRFRRLNPAFGISYVPSAQFNAYLGYAEGSRTPTSIELGCADPAFGCRLPNSMAGDPALKQVVSKTWELGLRGRLSHSVAGTVLWNAGLFRGDNTDEILFVSNSASTGYFKNFGKTRRAGLEAGLSTQTKTWRAGANYTYLRATYESAETVNAHYNSAADANGAIAITPGNRIPLMPAHLLKAHVDVQLQPQWWATLGMVAVGSSFVRGNENNAHIPNNQTALGTGRLPGYAAFNLATHYSPSKSLKLTLQINNLFNRQYATAGQLSPYAIQPSGGYNNSATLGTTALSPGAPRSLAVGARYAFE